MSPDRQACRAHGRRVRDRRNHRSRSRRLVEERASRARHCRDLIEAEVVHSCQNDQTPQADTIRARPVMEDEHCTIATVEADTHFDLDDHQQGYGDGVQEQLRELLVDEVFSNEEDEEQLDRPLPFALLREGEPVFRADDATAR
ncbi:hypothetical protein ACFXPY_33650 [Streptomyces sp. NPDC059153]|uniref:hypothetical protein n=1 Tax=Streptomyces sp. NPDC059153 TaxID=3346743 RepID=UPI00368ECB39